MPLRMTIISAHRESMGGGYIQEFSGAGGSIGRSLECDWPLPDAKRYVSSRHARIDYQAGCYYLVDLSRNGVYVNGSNTPVGKGNPQRLFDGDRVRIGEFEMECCILEERTADQAEAMADSVVRAQQVPVDESMEVSLLPPEQINGAEPLEAMLTPGDESGMVSAIDESPVQLARQDIAKQLASEFLQTAGLDPVDFEGLEAEAVLRGAARLLAAYTDGLRGLLHAKDAVTEELRLPVRDSGPSNPLKAADDSAQALRLLLASSNDIALGGREAADAAFAELSRHQRGVLNAMRVALQDYIACFAPHAVEDAFHGRGQRHSRFREMYAEAYAGLAKAGETRLPRRFDEDFVRAYELETQS